MEARAIEVRDADRVKLLGVRPVLLREVIELYAAKGEVVSFAIAGDRVLSHGVKSSDGGPLREPSKMQGRREA